MRGRVFVELQSPRQRVEHLRGRVLVAALLQPHVIVGAHASSQRHLRAPQSSDAAAPTQVLDADVVGSDKLAPGAEVLPDEVLAGHSQNFTPTPAVVIVAVLLPPSTVRLISTDVFVRQDYR